MRGSVIPETIKQHAGAALVAAGIAAAALIEGAFDPTAYAALSIVIWAAVIAGLASRSLPSSQIAVTAALAGLCLAAAVLLAGASVAWASDQGRAFSEAVRASAYLGLFTLAACTASRSGRGKWIAGLAAGLGAVAVVALLSYLQPGLLGWAGLDTVTPAAEGRLSEPIGYWNGLGALLALASILLAYLGAVAPERWQRSLSIAVVPLALLGIDLTGSRGAAVAAIAGLAVLVAASRSRPRQLFSVAVAMAGGAVLVLVAEQLGSLTDPVVDGARRADGDTMSAVAVAVALLAWVCAWLLDGRSVALRVSRRAAIGIAVAVGLAAAVAVIGAGPADRFRDFKQPPAPTTSPGADLAGGGEFSSSGRWQFWGEAVEAFDSAPVAGIGSGAFEDWWAQSGSLRVFVRNPHSLPLQQAAELGLLGVLLLVGFIGAVAVSARRRLSRDADSEGDEGVLVAVLVAAGLCAAIDWTWEIPAVFGPAVIAAGLLTASAPGRKLARHAYWLGLGAVTFAWVAMLAGGLVVLTELKLDQSRDAAAEGRIEEAVDRALEARTVQPWSPEPYTQLALLEEARGDYEQALVRVGQAEARDSEDWRLRVIEARLQVGRGDLPAARMALVKAGELNLVSPIVGPIIFDSG